jgi:hypothetical protein
MQACILAGGSVREAVRAPAAVREFPPERAPDIVRPSAALAPLERLDIYRGMYELRLREALEADYPGLHQYLGDDTFAELARLYVRENPSRSYTLNRLGDGLPEFVRSVVGLPRPAFVRDLARFELARTLVFDEEESPRADPAAVRDLPPDAWAGLRFRPIRAFRLLSLDHPVHEYLDAVRHPGAAPPVVRRKCRLALYRRDYAVLSLELSRPAFELLRGLAAGWTLGEAIEKAFASRRASERRLAGWFQEWFTQQLFAGIEGPGVGR